MESDTENSTKLQVSFSRDGSTYGLKNQTEYEWNFDDPMLHQYGTPKLIKKGTWIDESDPWIEFMSCGMFGTMKLDSIKWDVETKWFLPEAEVPSDANYCKIQLWDGVICQQETSLMIFDSELNIEEIGLMKITWYNRAIRSVSTFGKI